MVEEQGAPEGAELDQERVAALIDKLGDDLGQPVAEVPADPLAGMEFEPTMEHLYRSAKQKEVDGAVRWVYEGVEYLTDTKAYGKNRLGDFITGMETGPERWQLWAVLPSGAGMGAAVMRRKVQFVLPDPKPIETESHVEAPKDEEIARYASRADTWAASE